MAKINLTKIANNQNIQNAQNNQNHTMIQLATVSNAIRNKMALDNYKPKNNIINTAMTEEFEAILAKISKVSDELNYTYDYQIVGGIIQHGIFLFDSQYFYAYKAELHDIEQYNPYQKRWELFEDQFWGYPCMIQRMFLEDKKHTITSTSLWLVEKIFDTEAKARNHANNIENAPQELELRAFWEDIIGNG